MHKITNSKGWFPNVCRCLSVQCLFFLFFVYGFFKMWNYVADSNTHVCLCMKAISWFRLKSIKECSHRYVVATGMSTTSALSQRVENVTIAEHQYSSKILLSNCISRARFKRSFIRSSVSSPSPDILSKLKEHGFIIHWGVSDLPYLKISNDVDVDISTSKWTRISSKH